MDKGSLPPWLKQLWSELTTPPAILRTPTNSHGNVPKEKEDSFDELNDSRAEPDASNDASKKKISRTIQDTERLSRQYFAPRRTQRPPSKPRPKLPATKRKKKRIYASVDVVQAARNSDLASPQKRIVKGKKRRPTNASLTDWQARIISIEPIQGIWRMRTSEGKTYALKETQIPVERLRWLAEICDELHKQHFDPIPTILRTKSGSPYIFDGESLYYAYEWLPGAPLNYESLPHLGAAARTLARLHLISRELPPLRTPIKPFPLVPELRRKQQELELVAKELETKTAPDEFDLLFRSQLKTTLAQGETALSIFSRPEVDEAIRIGQSGLCHLSVNARNMIVSPTETVQLIDLDMMNYAPRVVDLAHLLRETMQARETWSSDIAIVPIVSYNRIEPLQHGEYLLLEALLTFPYRIHRLYKNHYTASSLTEEIVQTQTQELKRTMVLEADRSAFLHTFSRLVTRHQ